MCTLIGPRLFDDVLEDRVESLVEKKAERHDRLVGDAVMIE